MKKKPLTTMEQALLECCKDLDGFTTKEVSELFGKSTGPTATMLKRMCDKGYLARARIPSIRTDGCVASVLTYYLGDTKNKKKAERLQREYNEEKSGRRKLSLKASQDRGVLRKRIKELEDAIRLEIKKTGGNLRLESVLTPQASQEPL